MSIYAIGKRMERSNLMGYYLFKDDDFSRKYFEVDKLLQLYQSHMSIIPVSNLVLQDDTLIPLWEGALGLPRYDSAGILIGKSYEQGIYLTMSISTQHCEPPVSISNWQVTLYKDGFVQYMPAIKALKEGYDCIQKVMDEKIPVDGDILSIINILEESDNIFTTEGMKLHIHMDPRGLATVTVLEVTSKFTGSLKLNIKCKALLKFDISKFPDLQFDEFIIGDRIEQLCLHSLDNVKINTFKVEGRSRFTLEIAIDTGATKVDLSKSEGMILDDRLIPKCNFGTRLEHLKLPLNTSVIYYPTNTDNNLKTIEVGGTPQELSIRRELSDFGQLEQLVLPENVGVEDVVDIKNQLLSTHMRNTEVVRSVKLLTTSKVDNKAIEVKL